MVAQEISAEAHGTCSWSYRFRARLASGLMDPCHRHGNHYRGIFERSHGKNACFAAPFRISHNVSVIPARDTLRDLLCFAVLQRCRSLRSMRSRWSGCSEKIYASLSPIVFRDDFIAPCDTRRQSRNENYYIWIIYPLCHIANSLRNFHHLFKLNKIYFRMIKLTKSNRKRSPRRSTRSRGAIYHPERERLSYVSNIVPNSRHWYRAAIHPMLPWQPQLHRIEPSAHPRAYYFSLLRPLSIPDKRRALRAQ